MTANGKAAKKRTLVVRKPSSEDGLSRKSTKTSEKSKSAKSGERPRKTPVPKKPRVDEGPRAVKSWRDGRRLVARFFVAQFCGTQPYWAKKHRGQRGPYESKWYVMDCDSGRRALGTAEEGYDSLDEAKAVARRYRDEYGAYVEMPF